MDVTETNFATADRLLEILLPGAEFVAIDFEFTGLGINRPSNLDTPEQRYSYVRRDATEYPPIQFGLCIFHRHPSARPVLQQSAPDVSVTPPAKPVSEPIHQQTTPVGTIPSPVQSTSPSSPPPTASLNVQPSAEPQKRDLLQVPNQRQPIPLPDVLKMFPSGPTPGHQPLSPSPSRPDPASITAPSDPPPPGWISIPFNFNIHPRAVYYPPQERYPIIDKTFRMQASTVTFLGTHGFDFNRNFHEGVSWLRPVDEAFLRNHVSNILKRRHNPKQSSWHANKSQEDIKTVEDVYKKISAWVIEDKRPHQQQREPSDSSSSVPDDPKITLIPYPAQPGARRMIFELVRDKFPYISVSIRRVGPKLYFRLALFTTSDLAEKDRKRNHHNEVDDFVRPRVGIRNAIDLLRQHKVPIVVHHGLMDLAKLYGNFVGDLPPQLSDFKKKFAEAFPRMFDTRSAMERVSDWNVDVGEFLPRDPFVRHEMCDYVKGMREVARARKLHHISSFDTFIPTCALQKVDDPASALLIDRIDHMVIPEFARDWQTDGDRFGFGRYLLHSSKGFRHEAGNDALETGKLFVLIQAILGSNQNDAELWNKIHLSSCGGFRHIDIKQNEISGDMNDWLLANVVIVKGLWDEKGRDHRCRKILRRLTKNTIFDGNSNFVIVSKTIFVGLLRRKENGDDTFVADEVKKVIDNGSNLKLDVFRYELESLTVDHERGGDHKRRRFA